MYNVHVKNYIKSVNWTEKRVYVTENVSKIIIKKNTGVEYFYHYHIFWFYQNFRSTVDPLDDQRRMSGKQTTTA